MKTMVFQSTSEGKDGHEGSEEVQPGALWGRGFQAQRTISAISIVWHIELKAQSQPGWSRGEYEREGGVRQGGVKGEGEIDGQYKTIQSQKMEKEQFVVEYFAEDASNLFIERII